MTRAKVWVYAARRNRTNGTRTGQSHLEAYKTGRTTTEHTTRNSLRTKTTEQRDHTRKGKKATRSLKCPLQRMPQSTVKGLRDILIEDPRVRTLEEEEIDGDCDGNTIDQKEEDMVAYNAILIVTAAVLLMETVRKIHTWLGMESISSLATVATPRTRDSQQDVAGRCSSTWTPSYKSLPSIHGDLTKPVPPGAGRLRTLAGASNYRSQGYPTVHIAQQQNGNNTPAEKTQYRPAQ